MPSLAHLRHSSAANDRLRVACDQVLVQLRARESNHLVAEHPLLVCQVEVHPYITGYGRAVPAIIVDDLGERARAREADRGHRHQRKPAAHVRGRHEAQPARAPAPFLPTRADSRA